MSDGYLISMEISVGPFALSQIEYKNLVRLINQHFCSKQSFRTITTFPITASPFHHNSLRRILSSLQTEKEAILCWIAKVFSGSPLKKPVKQGALRVW